MRDTCCYLRENATSFFRESRLAYRTGGGFDYIGGVRENVNNAPDRYFYAEGMQRSRQSQNMMDDYRRQADAITRSRYEVAQHTREQDLRMRQHAVRANKYATAMARARQRKARLGLPYIDTGARIQMNRAILGMERQAPKLYVLDEIDDELFDRGVAINARRKTEERYPSSYSGMEKEAGVASRTQKESVDGMPERGQQFEKVFEKLIAAVAALTRQLAQLASRVHDVEKRQEQVMSMSRMERTLFAERTVKEITPFLRLQDTEYDLQKDLKNNESFTRFQGMYGMADKAEKQHMREQISRYIQGNGDIAEWDAVDEGGELRITKRQESSSGGNEA